MNQIKRSLVLGVLVLFGLSMVWQNGFSQTAIVRGTITSVDASKFPDVSMKVRLQDATQHMLTAVDAQELAVTEDKVPVTIDLNRVQIGVRGAIVLDGMSGMLSGGGSGASRWNEAKEIARQYIQKMGSGDRTILMVVNKDGVAIIQDFTNDKNLLTNSVNKLPDPDFTANATYTLEGVKIAIEKITSTPLENSNGLVLLVSQGILNARGDVESSVKTIVEMASKSGVLIDSVLTRYADEPFFADTLAKNSGGDYVWYKTNNDLTTLLDNVDRMRYLYNIHYRSASASQSERSIALSLNGSTTPLVTKTYTVRPAAPGLGKVQVNNGDPIQRKAEQFDSDLAGILLTEVNVTGSVSWPDSFQRKLKSVELFVNNESIKKIDNPDESFSAVWDIRNFTTKGETTATLKIVLTDELGLTASEEKQVQIEVVIPEKPIELLQAPVVMPVCDVAKKIPSIGGQLDSACRSLGITPTQLINFSLLVVLLIVVIILWFNRGKVAAVAGDVAINVTNVYNRLTQRSAGKKVKAKLEALQGLDSGERTDLDIYGGETPIGRDREHAVLVFANHPAISREHAIIHEDKRTGAWTIEDRESSNGTYLNGVALTPFEKTPINTGDILELAMVERGGIKFKFEIADGMRVETASVPVSNDDEDDSMGYEPANVRSTQHVPRRTTPVMNVPVENDEFSAEAEDGNVDVRVTNRLTRNRGADRSQDAETARNSTRTKSEPNDEFDANQRF